MPSERLVECRKGIETAGKRRGNVKQLMVLAQEEAVPPSTLTLSSGKWTLSAVVFPAGCVLQLVEGSLVIETWTVDRATADRALPALLGAVTSVLECKPATSAVLRKSIAFWLGQPIRLAAASLTKG
jgi:hypothetical protein